MSGQSGGSGYNKVKKSCQTGGADGWAKHCGSTDDHKKSNRIERRLGKHEIEDGRAPRMRGSRRDKVPTRRHLIDKVTALRAKVAYWTQWYKDHKPTHGLGWSPANSLAVSFQRDLDKVLKEFDKHGYERP